MKISWRGTKAKSLYITAIMFAVIMISAIGVFNPLDRGLRDLRFYTDDVPVSGDLVLIDIDSKSLAAIPSWPWDRKIHAELIERLSDANVDLIGFDIDFSSSSNEASDKSFAEAINSAEPEIILASFGQLKSVDAGAGSNRIHFNRPLDMLAENSWIASVNVTLDPDSKVRSQGFSNTINGEVLESFATVLGDHAGDLSGGFLIDYRINPDSFERYSYVDIIRGNFSPEMLSGKKVLIGASALELRDFFEVPKYGFITGHTLQAIMSETISQDRLLHTSSWKVEFATLLMLGAVIIITSLAFKLVGQLMFLTALAVLLELTAILLFNQFNLLMNTASALIFLVLSGLYFVLREFDINKLLISMLDSKRRNAERLLTRVVTENFDGILVLDKSLKIIHASSSAKTILRSGKELAGMKLDAISTPARIINETNEMFSHEQPTTVINPTPLEIDELLENGSRRVIEYTITDIVLDGDKDWKRRPVKNVKYVCISFREITERKIAEEQLSYVAHYDFETNLPNRNYLKQYIDGLAEKTNKGQIALARISIDRFDIVSHTLGHQTSLLLIKKISERISAWLPDEATFAHLGGRDFAICINALDDTSRVLPRMEVLIRELELPYSLENVRAVIGVYAGVQVAHMGEFPSEVLISHAGTALQSALHHKNAKTVMYNHNLDLEIQGRQQLEIELSQALQNNQLHLEYQPQVNLETGQMSGAEVLIRWSHPVHGMVSPETFIGIAEQSDLILKLGEWALMEACHAARKWPEDLTIAINVSPVQLQRADILSSVQKALNETGVNPERLELEITESASIEAYANTVEVLNDLKKLGVKISLDDFGTGYSSLNHVQKLPIDSIKIDKSFFSIREEPEKSAAIIQTICSFAKTLGLPVVAEGIETNEQEILAVGSGCAIGQGYRYGRPMKLPAIEALIEQDLVYFA